jgi:hypothetical protein
VVDFDIDKDFRIEGKDRDIGFHMEKNMERGMIGTAGMHIEEEKNMERGMIGTVGTHIEEKK